MHTIVHDLLKARYERRAVERGCDLAANRVRSAVLNAGTNLAHSAQAGRFIITGKGP
jgi:hypothetical protein